MSVGKLPQLESRQNRPSKGFSTKSTPPTTMTIFALCAKGDPPYGPKINLNSFESCLDKRDHLMSPQKLWKLPILKVQVGEVKTGEAQVF